jgi:hypothetical protein
MSDFPPWKPHVPLLNLYVPQPSNSDRLK